MARWSKIPKRYPVLVGVVLAFMASQVITTFHVVKEPHPYDWLVHFIFMVALSQLLFVVLLNYPLRTKPDEKVSNMSTTRVIIMVLLVGMAAGAAWEIIEFSADHLLGAHLQLGNNDTMGDLIADTIGSLLGSVILIFLSRHRKGA